MLRKLIALTSISMLLQACNIQDMSEKSEKGNSVDISSFSIEGSSENNGKQIINSAINSGKFVVSWSAKASGLYHAELFLNETAEISSSSSRKKLFSFNCDKNDKTGVYLCGTTGSSTCTFDGVDKISCSGYPSSVNVKSIVTELPKSAFMVLRLCPSNFENCKNRSIAVQLY